MSVDGSATSAVSLFGVCVNRLTLSEATQIALHWTSNDCVGPCRYIVTPNVNHAVMLRKRADLVAAYHDASMVIADGWPLVTVSRLSGQALPERVAGSDLVPQLLSASQHRGSFRLFLLGAAEGVGDRAASNIRSRWPHVDIAGILSPPIGFEQDEAENKRILLAIEEASPDLLVVGLGAPKQELWLHKHHQQLRAKVAIAAGGTIDFLAGEQTRAPIWAQRLKLEWAHRVASNPKRLAKRYLRDAMLFPPIAAREILRKRLGRS